MRRTSHGVLPMNKAIGLLLLLSVLVAQAQIKTHPNLNLTNSTQRSPLAYDRIEALERFIKIIYPDLATKLAMFEIEATFDEGHVHIRHIKIYPCNPMRVIAGCYWSTLHACRRHYPGRSDGTRSLVLSHQRRPSRLHGGLAPALHVSRPAQRSLHVTAYMLAKSPK